DDVDAGCQKAKVVGHRTGVSLRTAGGVHDAVGRQRNQRIGVVGGRDSQGFDPRKGPGVTARLVVRIYPYPNEFEIRTTPDPIHRDATWRTGRPHNSS